MILYCDCFSGISGNMFLGAMLELGIDLDWLKSELKKLKLPDEYEIIAEKTERCGIGGTYVNVVLPHEAHHGHNREHNRNCGHAHEHSHHHVHRNLYDIYKIIDDSGLSQNVKDMSKGIFQFIADAESKVHNKPFEELHFHEVGATDSIIDILGAAICIEKLAPEKIYAGSVALGSGFVECAHGKIPVPAPAVVEILKTGKIPSYASGIHTELVTPTGAAILAYFVDEFRACPEIVLQTAAYGAGSRNNAIPNMLRIFMGEEIRKSETQSNNSITEAVFQVDDMTGEALGFLMEKLFAAGAADVYFSSAYMKKNRPAVQVTVLYKKELHEKMTHIIFMHSSTLGFRFCEKERTEMRRTIKTLQSSDAQLGNCTIKVAEYDDIKKESLEYEALKKTAEALGLSLDELHKRFFKAL